MKRETIRAGSKFLKKEAVREAIEEIVVHFVKQGKIANDEELKEFWDSAQMAIKSLEMIPLQVLKILPGRSK